ncbi:hypothetical protein MFIFM68171_03404 [Madurella fahalii]|uniref:Zn(2)-C6 fungal-type domain-containing protein n=1 Tax=Madurella fahalii TaxID=1157608 RepID=A0ABQ0G629_9PEZI
MVGVPGRSKACITCRKRRKGCDLERPTCSQCKKAGLTCEGYNAHRVFVVSTPNSRHSEYSVPRGSHTTSRSWPQLNRDRVSNDTTNLRLLTRPEEERRCINLFWEAYFPAGQPIPTDASRSFTCAWTETARNFYREDNSLRYALWANCMVVIGRRHGAVWMLHEASKAYGKALSDLRRSLGASYRARRDASIATIKLLAAYIDGNSHDVFADERVDMALSAVLRRERLVLGTPEWKTIPWQTIPKDFKDILVDILVDIPGLVEDFDNMQLCAEESKREGLRFELVHKCWELDRQLLTWLGLLSQIGANPNQHPCLEPSWKDVVENVAQVHGMSLFWTASLVLYSILRMASGPQVDFPEHTDPTHHARKLVAAITILLQPGARLYGQQSAVLPLEIALQYTTVMPSMSDSQTLLDTIKTLKHRLHTGPLELVDASALQQGPAPEYDKA